MTTLEPKQFRTHRVNGKLLLVITDDPKDATWKVADGTGWEDWVDGERLERETRPLWLQIGDRLAGLGHDGLVRRDWLMLGPEGVRCYCRNADNELIAWDRVLKMYWKRARRRFEKEEL